MGPSCRVDRATCVGDVLVNTAKVIFADYTASTPRPTKSAMGTFAQHRTHTAHTAMSNWPEKETNEPLPADRRNFWQGRVME
jgi:hypothetical protein